MSATNRGAIRIDKDRYNTPEYATELICRHVNWAEVTSFCEPCRGSNAIWKVVIRYINNSTNMYWYEIDRGRDYLLPNARENTDIMITNPPYSLAQEFINMATTHCTTIIMLLRVNYLGAQKRREWWQTHLPTHMYVLSERPKFTVNKKGRLSGDATEYAWFVWETNIRMMRETPGIYVL